MKLKYAVWDAILWNLSGILAKHVYGPIMLKLEATIVWLFLADVS